MHMLCSRAFHCPEHDDRRVTSKGEFRSINDQLRMYVADVLQQLRKLSSIECTPHAVPVSPGDQREWMALEKHHTHPVNADTMPKSCVRSISVSASLSKALQCNRMRLLR